MPLDQETPEQGEDRRARVDDPDWTVPAPGPTSLFLPGLCTALWPILVVHACFALSVAEGFVEACNPYWDGCSSISRAGRSGWAFFLFKAGMLPYAALLAAFWWINHRWLGAAGVQRTRTMLVLGCLGVAFLVVYATFLGSEGPVYQLMRRFGIDVYFAATFFAQILLMLRLRRMSAQGSLRWLALPLALLAVAILSIGLFFYAAHLGFIQVERDRLKNTMEWAAALLMQLAILLTVFGWRADRLQLAIVRGGATRSSSPIEPPTAPAGPGKREPAIE